jgi:hypothetical protein
MLWTLLERFGPICMMAVLIIGNRAFMREVQDRKFCGEARRVRGAIAMSLQALRKLYEVNLGVLAGGKSPLIAGRNQIGLLRVQLARLMALEESEIEAVWGASIAAESAETAMALGGKALGNSAFPIPEGDAARDGIKTALTQACSMLESAEHLLAPEMSGDAQRSESATVIQFASRALRGRRRAPPVRAFENPLYSQNHP